MGSSRWSDESLEARSVLRASEGIEDFDYDKSIKTGKVEAKVHKTLDPSIMKAGMRECRDSEAHPNSTAIFVGLDVTGSMQGTPRVFQQELKQLMALLLKKGYVEDPAVCPAAIGDVEFDNAPFQLGQFESGAELEEHLINMFMEGGGGSNRWESYDLALYFLARCVGMDCWEKRKKKGYAFIICDESLSPTCKSSHLKKVFGKSEQDISTDVLMQEVLEKWNLFCVVPKGTSHYRSAMQKPWEKHLGQNVIYLDEPKEIVKLIGSCIGLCEEAVDHESLVTDLKDVGLSESSARTVTTALSKVGGTMSKLGGTGLAKL